MQVYEVRYHFTDGDKNHHRSVWYPSLQKAVSDSQLLYDNAMDDFDFPLKPTERPSEVTEFDVAVLTPDKIADIANYGSLDHRSDLWSGAELIGYIKLVNGKVAYFPKGE